MKQTNHGIPGQGAGGFASGEVLAVVLVYALLAGALTWPLTSVIGTELPLTAKACRFDSQLLGWALAHQSEAILSSPGELFNGGAFHPAARSILFGEAAFGALPYFLPVFALSGNPTLALNFTFLLAIALTATGVHLVVRRLTGNHAAGVVAVATLLGSRWLLWQWGPCAPNYAIILYLPWIFLFVVHGIRTRARMFGLAVLVALQGLASVYLAVAVYLLLGALVVAWSFSASSRREAARLAGALGLAALPLFLAFMPYLLTRGANPELADQSVWKGTMQLTRLPWGPLDARVPTGVPLSALVLTALGALLLLRQPPSQMQRRAWRQAAFWLVLGVVVSFTPLARMGDEVIRLPHAWLGDWFGAYDVIRAPHRLGVVALVGLSLASGLSFALVAQSLGRGRFARVALAVLWLCVVVGETRGIFGSARYARPARLPASYPTFVAPGGEGEVMAALRSGTGPVLELPVPKNKRGRMAPEPQVAAMYRSIFHGRPVLNGYSGYWPSGFEERLAVARRLPARAALRELAGETDLRAILVHTAALPPRQRARWIEIAAAGGNGVLGLVARDASGDLLFRVRPGA